MGKKYQTDSEATTYFRHVYTHRNFSKNKRNNLMIKKTQQIHYFYYMQ